MFVDFSQLTVTAAAKVNLHLKVKDKRPDGFHNLESIFLALDFGDILHFEPISGINTVEINMAKPVFSKSEPKKETELNSIPLQGNIIFKALSLFRDKTGFKQGIKIEVEKNIPIGGGLGGGSSDAAAALLALNEIAGNPLNRDTILDMAGELGSDVPFFIYETQAAFISGRGEIIMPIESPCLFFVLVNPGFPSDTAAAYKLLDEYRNSGKRKDEREINKDVLLHSCFSISQLSFFFNDFLPVFNEREKSVYNDIISQLQELGADFASLSGAGSTCFGVFRTREAAQNAAEALCDRWPFVKHCGLRMKL